MKIELRNFKPSHSQSRETLAFTASIVVDSLTVGTVSNDGGGGANRCHYGNAETRERVREAIEAFPVDPRFPTLPMNEDFFFSRLADALVAADDAKRLAKKEATFSLAAHDRGMMAFRIAITIQGAEASILVESKMELTREAANVIATKHGGEVVSITRIAAPGEMSLAEAHGVIKMAQILKAVGYERCLIARDATWDWLAERGFVRVQEHQRVQNHLGTKVFATKIGRAWFHSLPGPGVALEVDASSDRSEAKEYRDEARELEAVVRAARGER